MSREFNPEVVASSFIKQFYEKLSKNPHELHRFYKEESFFTHCDGQQPCIAVSGIENIKNKVIELNLAGSKVDLSEGSLDAHRSEVNGVVMLVTGLFTPSDSNIARPFVQTFFLSSQHGDNQHASVPSYFVRNSVFRVFSHVIPSTQLLIETNVNVVEDIQIEEVVIATTKPVEAIEVMEEVEVTQVVEVVEEEIVNVNEVSEEVTNTLSTQLIESNDNNYNTSNVNVIVEVPEKKEKGKPKTWADALKRKVEEESIPIKANTSIVELKHDDTIQVTNGNPKNSNSKNNRNVHRNKDKTRESNAGPSTSITISNEDNYSPKYHYQQPFANKVLTSDDERKYKHSIYIRRVKETITESEIIGAFAKFGKIVDLELQPIKGYAFIEFESIEATRAVLTQKEPIRLSDRALEIYDRALTPVNSPHGHFGNKGHDNNRKFVKHNDRQGQGSNNNTSSNTNATSHSNNEHHGRDRKQHCGQSKDQNSKTSGQHTSSGKDKLNPSQHSQKPNNQHHKSVVQVTASS